jgi:exosortase C (VPDSG-CTERM-specific)
LAVRGRVAGLAAAAVALLVLFARPIGDLGRLAYSSDLYSYIFLIPPVSFFLIWIHRRDMRFESRPAWRPALLALSIGLILLAAYARERRTGWDPADNDYLALMMVSFLSLLLGACFLALGSAAMRAIAFPAAFLIFIAPLPTQVHDWIERFLQVASADVAHALFWMSLTPVLRQGMIFNLPGFPLEVAPECSGLHSTLILFITSLLAAHLFLRSTWKRALLVLAVVPVALARNGLRIFIIGELCVHVGPRMIDSYIHRHGGPIFFIASLLPFFFFLLYLQKSESFTAHPQ